MASGVGMHAGYEMDTRATAGRIVEEEVDATFASQESSVDSPSSLKRLPDLPGPSMTTPELSALHKSPPPAGKGKEKVVNTHFDHPSARRVQ